MLLVSHQQVWNLDCVVVSPSPESLSHSCCLVKLMDFSVSLQFVMTCNVSSFVMHSSCSLLTQCLSYVQLPLLVSYSELAGNQILSKCAICQRQVTDKSATKNLKLPEQTFIGWKHVSGKS